MPRQKEKRMKIKNVKTIARVHTSNFLKEKNNNTEAGNYAIQGAKGITLVALIVTIIILIILAGVGINITIRR